MVNVPFCSAIWTVIDISAWKEPAVHFYLRPVKLFTGDVDVDQLSALIFGPQFPKRSFLCQTHVFFSPSFQQ